MISKSALNNILSCHDKADKQQQAADPWHQFGCTGACSHLFLTQKLTERRSCQHLMVCWEILKKNIKAGETGTKGAGFNESIEFWGVAVPGWQRRSCTKCVWSTQWCRTDGQQSQDSWHQWAKAAKSAKSAFPDLEPHSSWAGTVPFSNPRSVSGELLHGTQARAALAIFPQLLTTFGETTQGLFPLLPSFCWLGMWFV